jgi:hypothetical protein
MRENHRSATYSIDGSVLKAEMTYIFAGRSGSGRKIASIEDV